MDLLYASYMCVCVCGGGGGGVERNIDLKEAQMLIPDGTDAEF